MAALTPCDVTPCDVTALLQLAYLEDLDVSGHQTLGHKVEASEGELMYGELLTSGVTKALERLGAKQSSGKETLLELGSGTGKVALQAFLECPGLRRVVGVELSRARHDVAVTALSRLADQQPGFTLSHPGPDRSALQDTGGRMIELQCGDLTATDAALVREARFLLLQVVLPEHVQTAAQRMQLHVVDGCRALMLKDLSRTWALEEPCPWHPVGSASVDYFATSWSPVSGHRLHLYEADSSRAASITLGSALETMEADLTEGHAL